MAVRYQDNKQVVDGVTVLIAVLFEIQRDSLICVKSDKLQEHTTRAI